ncbi:MAG: hypothetical protein M0Z70_13135 [Nitrospiraceae bacterium]|jgi:hypothetical protein|nr:hypothetical protein [Nitrospiraceae bacterium]
MQELKFVTLPKVAEQAKKLFKFNERTEQRNAFFSFTAEAIETDKVCEAFSRMNDMAKKLDQDSVYEYTVEALDHIIENQIEDVKECDIHNWADKDVDIDTSDLTEWLNRSEGNVEYLTEVLEERGELDGFYALLFAQMKAREEVYLMVLEVLSELIEADGGIDGTDQE